MFADSIGRDLPRAAAEVIPFIAGFRGIKTPIPSWVTETIELLCEQGDPSLDAIKIRTSRFSSPRFVHGNFMQLPNHLSGTTPYPQELYPRISLLWGMRL
jgi:hypothetical protein